MHFNTKTYFTLFMLFLILTPALPFTFGKGDIVLNNTNRGMSSEDAAAGEVCRLLRCNELVLRAYDWTGDSIGYFSFNNGNKIPFGNPEIIVGPEDVLWVHADGNLDDSPANSNAVLMVIIEKNGEVVGNITIDEGERERLHPGYKFEITPRLIGPECCSNNDIFELTVVRLIAHTGSLSRQLDFDELGVIPIPDGRQPGGFTRSFRWGVVTDYIYTSRIIVVGPGNDASSNTELSNTQTLQSGKFIINPHDHTREYGLFIHGREKTLIEGEFGSIEYFNVVNPNGIFQLDFKASDPILRGKNITLAFESPRKYSRDYSDNTTTMFFSRNGTVGKTGFMVANELDPMNSIQFELPKLSDSMSSGDTPLQYGLHNIHLYARDQPDIFNIYIPVFVIDPVDLWESPPYRMIDFSNSPSSTLNFDLTEILPTSVLLASTDFMRGVTTNMTLQEINTPLARVDIFNRAEQLSDYDLLFDEDVQYTFSDEGTMYLLADDFDTNLNIGSLSINNFVIQNYDFLKVVSDGDGNFKFDEVQKIQFPDRFQINLDLQNIYITLQDEIGNSVNKGTVTISNQYGTYSFPIMEGHTLRLENSDYFIKHVMDDRITLEKPLIVSASDTLELEVNTIQTYDYALTGLLFIEISVFLFFTVKLFSGLTKAISASRSDKPAN